MNPQSTNEFFLASAGVAGALIGLLFVAISVSQDRLTKSGKAQIHQLRAAAALSAFTNALVVSLFALIPDNKLGWSALSMGIIGWLFVLASLLVLVRGKIRWRDAGHLVFLLGLAATFTVQVIAGISSAAHPDSPSTQSTIAIIVIVCFLIGISRAWDLIGGPTVGFTHEVFALLRGKSNLSDTDTVHSAQSTD